MCPVDLLPYRTYCRARLLFRMARGFLRMRSTFYCRVGLTTLHRLEKWYLFLTIIIIAEGKVYYNRKSGEFSTKFAILTDWLS